MSVCTTTSGFRMIYVPPPGPPLNLTSTPTSSSQVTLSWSAAVPQPGTTIAKYLIYRQSQGNWPPAGNTASLSFTDSGLQASTDYTYYVIAVDSKGAVSIPSNQTTVTTLALLPSAPTNLAVTSTSPSTVALSWTAVAGAISYSLYRNGVRIQTGIASTIVTATGLAASTTYSFFVTAVNGAGESAHSNTVNATTGAATSARFKFNPGVYWQLDYNQSKSAQFSRMAALVAKVPETAGFTFRPTWGDLENPALVGGAAQYDGSWATGDQTVITNQRGYKLLDSFIAECARLGVQLSIQVRCIGGGVTPGTQTSFPSASVPPYLNSTTYGPVNSSTGEFGGAWINNQSTFSVRFAWYLRWWDQRTMNRINAYGQALGARYDSNPTVEAVGMLSDEMVVDPQTGCTDAGQIATMTGSGGYMAIWRAAFPHTMVRVWFNYFQTTATMDTMIAEAYLRQMSVGGPDTANEAPVSSSDPTLNSDGIYRAVTSDWRWLGYTAATGDGGVRDTNLPDYKAKGGHRWCEVEAEDTSYDTVTNTTVANSRHIGDGILPHIFAQANRLGVTHPSIFDNTFSGRAQVQTNTAHPNLCDFVRSMLQGGNIAVNGVTAGIALNPPIYPSSFPQ